MGLSPHLYEGRGPRGKEEVLVPQSSQDAIVGIGTECMLEEVGSTGSLSGKTRHLGRHLTKGNV